MIIPHDEIVRAFSFIPEGYRGYVYGSAALFNHPDAKRFHHLISDIDLWIKVPWSSYVDELKTDLSARLTELGLQHTVENKNYTWAMNDHRFWRLYTVPGECKDDLTFKRPVQIFATTLNPQQLCDTADLSCHAFYLTAPTSVPGGTKGSLAPGYEIRFLPGAMVEPMDSLARYFRFCERYGQHPNLGRIREHVAKVHAAKRGKQECSVS